MSQNIEGGKTPYDPFAEENIRLPQEMLDEAIAHTELTIVPVQKPGDQEFIRVHPSADYRHIAAIRSYFVSSAAVE